MKPLRTFSTCAPGASNSKDSSYFFLKPKLLTMVNAGSMKRVGSANRWSCADACIVCFGEYVDGEQLCRLPCRHVYHAQVRFVRDLPLLEVSLDLQNLYTSSPRLCDWSRLVCYPLSINGFWLVYCFGLVSALGVQGESGLFFFFICNPNPHPFAVSK